jgi:hypothetical protein
LIEWFGREQKFAIAKLDVLPNRFLRWVFYFILISALLIYNGKEQQFIYFQF